jgi:hypothetical protein
MQCRPFKKPALSSNRLMMMTAINVAVAFQTICHTSGISDNCMTPASKASNAPPAALQPMPRPRGCQMTKVSVSKNQDSNQHDMRPISEMNLMYCEIIGWTHQLS